MFKIPIDPTRWDDIPNSSSTDFDPLPKGKYTIALDRVQFITDSKAPFAMGQPEISMSFKVAEGPYEGRLMWMSIHPEVPAREEEKNGKTVRFSSGIERLKQTLVCLGIEIPGKEVSPERVQDELLDAAQSHRKMIGYTSNGKHVHPQGPVDPQQIKARVEDYDSSIPF